MSASEPRVPFASYFEQLAPEPVVACQTVIPAGEPLIPRKAATVIEVPDELLMDMGVIPDTRPPRPPPPRRIRFRWWRQRQRERAARAAYRLIAGYDPPGDPDE